MVSFCLFKKYFHGNCYDLFFLVLRLHKFKRATRLASWSRHFIVEIVKCNRYFFSDSFFSHSSCMWNSFSFISSLITTTFKNLNSTSIAIYCSSFILSSFLLYTVIFFPLASTLCNLLPISGTPALPGAKCLKKY